jgi:hypothetical protein
MKPTPKQTRSKMTSAIVRSALVLLATAASSQAAFISSPTGIITTNTITFDEVVIPNGSALTNQYAAYGVNFQGMYYNTQPITFGGVSAPVAENFNPISNPFSILFTNAQSQADFNFITNDGEITLFEAYLGGVLQDSGSVATGIADTNYYGFSGVTFDEIRISVSNNVNGAAALDNIQFNAEGGGTHNTPDTGSTLAMFGLGLTGLSAVRRKLKRA